MAGWNDQTIFDGSMAGLEKGEHLVTEKRVTEKRATVDDLAGFGGIGGGAGFGGIYERSITDRSYDTPTYEEKNEKPAYDHWYQVDSEDDDLDGEEFGCCKSKKGKNPASCIICSEERTGIDSIISLHHCYYCTTGKKLRSEMLTKKPSSGRSEFTVFTLLRWVCVAVVLAGVGLCIWCISQKWSCDDCA